MPRALDAVRRRAGLGQARLAAGTGRRSSGARGRSSCAGRCPVSAWVLLGLAYLSRQEAIWLARGFVVMVAVACVAQPAGGRRVRVAAATSAPVVVGGLLVVVPWLIRRRCASAPRSPARRSRTRCSSATSTSSAYAERPDAAELPGQGLSGHRGRPGRRPRGTSSWSRARAARLPGRLAGLVACCLARAAPGRCAGPRHSQALLLSGGLTFLVTALVFPVATLWGTFLHASGPLLVGPDRLRGARRGRLLARISSVRHWERPNVLVGPVALLAWPCRWPALQVATLARQTHAIEARVERVADDLRADRRLRRTGPTAAGRCHAPAGRHQRPPDLARRRSSASR